jgi:hypothetical protein
MNIHTLFFSSCIIPTMFSKAKAKRIQPFGHLFTTKKMDSLKRQNVWRVLFRFHAEFYEHGHSDSDEGTDFRYQGVGGPAVTTVILLFMWTYFESFSAFWKLSVVKPEWIAIAFQILSYLILIPSNISYNEYNWYDKI